MKPTTLRFFNELDEPALQHVFTTRSIETLAGLGAGITMGLRDRSVGRAQLIRRLAEARVPVGGWLLLPPAQGYFATHDNVELIEGLVDDTLRWAEREALPLEAIGLDFEPPLDELQSFMANPLAMGSRWSWRARDQTRWRSALTAYQRLVTRITDAGLKVETYQFPLLLADREAKGSLWQRVAGGLDVKGEREVVMVYSSLLGLAGSGLVERVAPRARAIGIGSTGGGIDPFPKLSWPALEHDLLLASAQCTDVSIFSFEGCVENDYLERLRDFDWQRAVTATRGARLTSQLIELACTGLSSWSSKRSP